MFNETVIIISIILEHAFNHTHHRLLKPTVVQIWFVWFWFLLGPTFQMS